MVEKPRAFTVSFDRLTLRLKRGNLTLTNNGGTMKNEINNSMDIIDSRDVIARIDELEGNTRAAGRTGSHTGRDGSNRNCHLLGTV